MSEDSLYIGIDVSKAQLDVAVRPGNQHWQVSHTEEGTEELISQLTGLCPTLLVMEASGGLEIPLAASLAAASLPVVVVNPRQVRDFARAIGTLARQTQLMLRCSPISPRQSSQSRDHCLVLRPKPSPPWYPGVGNSSPSW